MKREFEDESEVDIWSGFEVRIAIAISFESDGEIEAEIKSYLKMGWFKTGRSFQMIINVFHGSAWALTWEACYARGMPKAL